MRPNVMSGSKSSFLILPLRIANRFDFFRCPQSASDQRRVGAGDELDIRKAAFFSRWTRSPAATSDACAHPVRQSTPERKN